LASGARPGLAQVALALARILDNPKAVNQQPAATPALVYALLAAAATRDDLGGYPAADSEQPSTAVTVSPGVSAS
jgi:hypothetical protein